MYYRFMHTVITDLGTVLQIYTHCGYKFMRTVITDFCALYYRFMRTVITDLRAL